jgi:hypothetical protein
MDETTMSAEDRLKNIEAERKELKSQVAQEKAERLSKAAGLREIRDAENKRVSSVLTEVQKEIFAYNKSGKVLKAKNPILETIAKLVSPQAEAVVEEITEEPEVEAETPSY